MILLGRLVKNVPTIKMSAAPSSAPSSLTASAAHVKTYANPIRLADLTVEDLKKSLPDEQKGLVDEFIDSLNSEFYLRDADAHDAAVSLALANDDSSAEEKSSPLPLGYRIEEVYHPDYGFRRVVRHP